MKVIKFLSFFSVFFVMAGCAELHCKKPKGSVLTGTDTAVVGIYIDDNGYPQAEVDVVTVRPGQNIKFVGPSKFDILFKDQRSPIDKLEVPSVDGVVTIQIPRDIFDRQSAAAARNLSVKELIYRYGIRVNGKITDPTIHIEPQ